MLRTSNLTDLVHKARAQRHRALWMGLCWHVPICKRYQTYLATSPVPLARFQTLKHSCQTPFQGATYLLSGISLLLTRQERSCSKGIAGKSLEITSTALKGCWIMLHI